MERHIYNDLKKWKDSPKRKPLILLGARQVGKTYTLKQLARMSLTIWFTSIVITTRLSNLFL